MECGLSSLCKEERKSTRVYWRNKKATIEANNEKETFTNKIFTLSYPRIILHSFYSLYFIFCRLPNSTSKGKLIMCPLHRLHYTVISTQIFAYCKTLVATRVQHVFQPFYSLQPQRHQRGWWARLFSEMHQCAECVVVSYCMGGKGYSLARGND